MIENSPCGILVVDKPSGCTSHDVVNRVRRAYKTRQVGHTGTLDPMATGVMVLCIGMATRLAEYLTACNKHYTAEFQIGIQSDSYDTMGTVTKRNDASHITRQDVERALKGFVGSIQQTPPMVSAVHYQGKRLYQLAREGKVVEREPRNVCVEQLDLSQFEPGYAATATLEITCSSGFYVRVLADDLGKVLSVGAIMSALRRQWVGYSPQDSFTVDRAITLDRIIPDGDAASMQELLIPMEQAVAHYPRFTIEDQSIIDQISHGIAVPLTAGRMTEQVTTMAGSDIAVLLSPEGSLLAVARVADGTLHPFKVFHAQ